MVEHVPEPHWHVNWLKPGLPWRKEAIRPAEIGDRLCKIVTARDNLLEDAEYNKVVPNHFRIELTPLDYEAHFAPLEKSLLQQWHDRLLEHLEISNSRLGHEEYRLVGQLLLELGTASDLKDNQARILCCVEPGINAFENNVAHGSNAHTEELAHLELVNGDRSWPLYPGINTIGRDPACDIFLDLPLIQEKRIISAQHAMIRIEGNQNLLFDGGPSRKPSANGTYLNSQRVDVSGVPLTDGDIIILAALDPRHPQIDAPGTAAFHFRKPPPGTNRV